MVPAGPSAPDPEEIPMKNALLTLHRAWGLAHPGAEYAIGTLAAAAFAGLLLAIMRSGSLRGTLQSLIESALSV